MKMTEPILGKEVPLAQLMELIQERLEMGKSVRFAPQGISMWPMLRQGIDSVVISPLPQTLKKYDLPLYRRDDGSFALHRIVQVGEVYTCVGDNQYQKETGVRKDQMIALVTAFYRGNKRHSVKNPAYWLYCRVNHYTRGLRHRYSKLKNRQK